MIDILLLPSVDCFTRTVSVDIVVRSEEPVWIHAADIAVTWHPRRFELIDCDQSRATIGNTIAGVPGIAPVPAMPWDYYGANARLDDGNGYFMWLGPLTGAANAIYVEEAILGTLVFAIVGEGPSEMRVADVLQAVWPLETAVYAGEVPGLDLSGDLGYTKIPPCIAAAGIEP